MSYYRDLNKELIGQVQSMRIDMKLYCDEIVHLKGELMQKHETEVILRKECYNWALESFIQLLQTVQPECDILPVLKDYWQPPERISSGSTVSTASTSPRRSRITGERLSQSSRRRSSQLTVEFQRSNSILNSRKSICSTSPIRRSSNENKDGDDEEEVESVDEEEQEENEVMETENDSEQVEKETEIPQQQPDENLNIIYEDSEKEDEEEAEHETDEDEQDYEQNVESSYESVEEITVDDMSVCNTRSTLKDVTNTKVTTIECSNLDKSVVKSLRKRGRPRNDKKTNIIEQENSIHDIEVDLDMEQSATLDNSRPIHHTRLADKSDTLQEPRRYSNNRQAPMRNKSIPITQDFNHTCREITLSSSPTSLYTDMTLRNFKEAACSTPNSRHNSLRKPTTPPAIHQATISDTATSSSTNCSSSRRPSRQCKPKDLAEPKLSTKLRNETACESNKSRPKSKSRNKKGT